MTDLNSLSDDMLINSRKAAELLGISTVTLARWRAEKKGPPFIRLGPTRVGYPVGRYREWVAARAASRPRSPSPISGNERGPGDGGPTPPTSREPGPTVNGKSPIGVTVGGVPAKAFLTQRELRRELRMGLGDFIRAVVDHRECLPEAYRFGGGRLLFAAPGDLLRKRAARFLAEMDEFKRGQAGFCHPDLIEAEAFRIRYRLSVEAMVALTWDGLIPDPVVLVAGRVFFPRAAVARWEAGAPAPLPSVTLEER